MNRVDQYKHLNIKNELGVNCGMEEMAKFVVSQNYGAHRLLSAMVHELREYHKKYGDSPIADRIEEMLNEGLYC